MGSHYHRQMNFLPVATSLDASDGNSTATSETEGLCTVCTKQWVNPYTACSLILFVGVFGLTHYGYDLLE